MDRVQNSLEKDNSLVQFVMVKRGQPNDTSHIQKELRLEHVEEKGSSTLFTATRNHNVAHIAYLAQ